MVHYGARYEGSQQEITIVDNRSKGHESYSTRSNIANVSTIPITYGVAEYLGRLVGDGNINTNDNRVEVAFNEKELESMDRLKEVVEELGVQNCGVCERF